jgi:protein phosphatase
VTAIVADVVDDDVHGAPIVGGAAADAAEAAPAAASGDTPAARAAQINRRPPDPAHARPARAAADEPQRRRSRLPIVVALVVLLVAAGVVATWLYTRQQYYVGATADAAENVAVYRGVSGSVLGVDLSSVSDRTDLPVAALPEFEQNHVRNGIDATSRTDAERIVATLRRDACPAPPAVPTPSSSATPAVTPRRSPSPAPSPGTSHAPAATPAATPTPAYCHG